MLQNKVLVLGVNVVLAALVCLTTEGAAQLAPADRPPIPPAPPPAITFGSPGTTRPSTISGNVRYQLIPVASQQAARSPPRGQLRSISTYPAVSQPGYAQPPTTTNTRGGFAQPTILPVGYVQSQRTATPQAAFGQPQRTIQPQAAYVQPQRMLIPQAVFTQPQRVTQPQAGFAQPQRTLVGSITSYPARSQVGYAQSQVTFQPRTNFAQPLSTTNTRGGFAQPVGYVQSQRTATPQAAYAQPQRNIQTQAGYAQPQRTLIPQAVFTPRRVTQPQAGFAQPQRTVAGSVTSYSAQSQVG